MESKLRERLIGALVLVALAVLILPWLLDDDKRSGQFHSQIPAQPVNNASRIIELQQPRPLTELAQNDVAVVARTQGQPSEPIPELTPEPTQARSSAPESSPSPAGAPTEVSTTGVAPETTVVETKPAAADKEQNPPASVPAETFANATDQAVQLPAASTGKGFVVQLGSFSNSENAKALVSKLQGRGFKAYGRAFVKDGKSGLRVLVGPYLEQKSAQADVAKLQLLSGAGAMVSAFDPLKH